MVFTCPGGDRTSVRLCIFLCHLLNSHWVTFVYGPVTSIQTEMAVVFRVEVRVYLKVFLLCWNFCTVLNFTFKEGCYQALSGSNLEVMKADKRALAERDGWLPLTQSHKEKP